MGKAIFVEKIFDTKVTPYEKALNHLTVSDNIRKEDTDKLLSKLNNKERNKLLKIVERDTDPITGDISEKVARNIKVISEIFRIHPNKQVPTYKVGVEFFKLVKELKRGLPANILANSIEKEKFHYILFNDYKFEGALISILNLTEIPDSLRTAFSIRISFIPKEYDPSNLKTFYIVSANQDILNLDDLVQTDTLDPSEFDIKEMEKKDGELSAILCDSKTENIAYYRPLINGLINTLIYIYSKDPEIEELRPIKLYDKKELASLSFEKKVNLCTIPVTLVNFSYHGKVFSKNKTSVRPHLRWQQCGVGRKETKLIWVKEHTRTFNKEVINDS